MSISETKTLTNLIETLSKKINIPINIMEVCGTHTAEIFRHGIREILPCSINLISGPGCPVCVTSITDIDKAISIALLDDIILTTFGDIMRVPGGSRSLAEAKAEGADIRVVYSPRESLNIARLNKQKRVVFLSIGFETTVPLIAATLSESEQEKIDNFYIYPVNKLLPPALEFLLKSKETQIDGFLLPGHVSTIIGSRAYDFISYKYSIPSVITGFGVNDILAGIAMLLRQIYEGRKEIEVQYKSVVTDEGNKKALALINRYFEPTNAYWRGIGLIGDSGLSLRVNFRHKDINIFYDLSHMSSEYLQGCMCGYILKGLMRPTECGLFGDKCTPANPIGACMVSEEGSCSIYYKYYRK